MSARFGATLLAFAVIAASLAGCLERDPGDGPPASNDFYSGPENWRVIAEGWSSRMTERSSATASTESAWRTLWANHAPSDPPEARPSVDFGNERVLAVFAGDMPHPGWRIDLTHLATFGANATTVARVVILSPPPDQAFPSVIAQPFVFVAFPARATTVEVVWSESDPAGGSQGSAVSENWRSLESGNTGTRSDRGHLVIETESEWRDFWANHSTRLTPGDAPEVDFRTERVLALFAGEKSHTGWSVNLTALRTHDVNATTVAHASIDLASGDVFGQAITRPYLLVAFAKRDTQVDINWA